MNLNETIECLEMRLADPKKSLESMAREISILHHLKAYRSFLGRLNDEMLPGRKHCYRYGSIVVEQCEVCEKCVKPEDLAWNQEVEE